jgi:hypothetical protein
MAFLGRAAALLIALMTAIVPAAAPEDSVFVYDVFRGRPDCAAVAGRLRGQPLQPTVILSVEQGPDLVLDWPGGEASLACASDALHASGHSVKAMILQDPSHLKNQTEALRRARAVSQFAAAHKDLISSVVIDVEPYTDDAWDCAPIEGRRQIAASYRELVGRLRAETRPLPLEIIVPWWFGVEKNFPILALASLGEVADGTYLMVYGDEGGPVVNGGAGRAAERIDLLLAADRPQVPFYIALATYEAASAAALNREREDLTRKYGGRPHFGGTSVFHSAGAFNAPLVHIVSGTIADPAGRGLAGASVTIHGRTVETNGCGHFTIRGVAPGASSMTVAKSGYRSETTKIDLARPGVVKDLPSVVLRPN